MMLRNEIDEIYNGSVEGHWKSAKQEHGLKHIELPTTFYCEWLPEATQTQRLRKEGIKKYYPNCCFNHKVGLPTLKYEDEEFESEGIPLNNYEKRIIENYEKNLYYAQNKCRGAGATELKTVRHNAFKYCLNEIPGRKCLVVAGINQDVANIMLGRIKELLDRIPEIYLIPPRSDTPHEIFLKGGGMILSIPARANALRSFENVGDVDLEESAFWNMTNDDPVLKSAEPHAIKSNAKISSITTPNGQRGFVWDKIFNPDIQSKYYKHTINWREVVGIPVQTVEEMEGLDFDKREFIADHFTKRYENDMAYRKWFDDFFPGLTIKECLDVAKPILDVDQIIKIYYEDRATYDQELDNQFLLSENHAFGKFNTGDFEPVDFE
jgi:hypothetical protein